MIEYAKCPYGGGCIDFGIPSDCLINSRCVNFSSAEEKARFDDLPDHFVVRLGGFELKMKNLVQLKFFLNDCYEKVSVYALLPNKLEIPVDVKKLFREKLNHVVTRNGSKPKAENMAERPLSDWDHVDESI